MRLSPSSAAEAGSAKRRPRTPGRPRSATQLSPSVGAAVLAFGVPFEHRLPRLIIWLPSVLPGRLAQPGDDSAGCQHSLRGGDSRDTDCSSRYPGPLPGPRLYAGLPILIVGAALVVAGFSLCRQRLV